MPFSPRKTLLILALLSVFGFQLIYGQTQGRNFVPIRKEGKMSNVVLAYMARQNIIPDLRTGNKYEFPDGLEFYFVIHPRVQYSSLTIDDFQNWNFRINDILYNKISHGTINPHGVLYNYDNYFKNEPDIGIATFFDNDGFVVKIIICGEKLPNTGNIKYKFNFGFGFDGELEEFEFETNL